MTKLIRLWAWVKLNAMMLAIFAAVLAFCLSVSYLQGRTDGKAACEARYEKEKTEGNAAVVKQLAEINLRNSALIAQWEEQNRLTNAALEREVQNTYRVVEKIIEKPVPVTGDCSISYDVVGVLNDAARGSTDSN